MYLVINVFGGGLYTHTFIWVHF